MDSRAGFTPGPWLIHATNRVIVKADEAFDEVKVKDGKVVGDGKMPTSICLLRDPDEEFSEDETLANGFLIAAAPELYEALEPFARSNPHKSEDGLSEAMIGVTIADIRRAKAALAKARGETPNPRIQSQGSSHDA